MKRKYNIPIFKLSFNFLFKLKILRGVWDILTSGRPLGESKYVEKFENDFSNLIGSKFAVSCSNGTTALELALKSVNVKDKTVLIPANTFFATSVAVENSGGKIKLVDLDPNNFSLDYEDLKRNVNELDNIGAVIIVHVGGIISDKISNIIDLCKSKNIPLIEDSAHAHGSFLNGFTAGTLGDISCFSFFPTKVMTTGEGGIITTNNEDHYKNIKSLKNFGRDLSDSNLIVKNFGNNYKINEFIGLMGYLECDRVLSRIKKRNELIDRYVINLKNTGYKIIQQKSGRCSYYKCIIVSKYDNQELKDYCKNNNITLTGEVYKIPIHQQPLYKEQFINEKFVKTDYISKHHICPPLYPELTFDEINYICDILKKFENEKQSS